MDAYHARQAIIRYYPHRSWCSILHDKISVAAGGAYDLALGLQKDGLRAVSAAYIKGIREVLISTKRTMDGIFVVVPGGETAYQDSGISTSSVVDLNAAEILNKPTVIRECFYGVYGGSTTPTRDKILTLHDFMLRASWRCPNMKFYLQTNDYADLVAFVSHQTWRWRVVVVGSLTVAQLEDGVGSDGAANWRQEVELAPLLDYWHLLAELKSILPGEVYGSYYQRALDHCNDFDSDYQRGSYKVHGYVVEYRWHPSVNIDYRCNEAYGSDNEVLAPEDAAVFVIQQALLTFAVDKKRDGRVIIGVAGSFVAQQGNVQYCERCKLPIVRSSRAMADIISASTNLFNIATFATKLFWHGIPWFVDQPYLEKPYFDFTNFNDDCLCQI